MTIKYSQPTGLVFVRNFDEGIMARIGAVAEIRDHPILGERKGYWLDVATSDPTSVPVIFNDPEPIYERRIYPSILVVRGDPTPNMVRWQSVGQLEYVAGVSGTEQVGMVGLNAVSGFSQIESKIQAIPFDIEYTVTCFARWEHEAMPMINHLLKRFQPFSRIPVVDSLGQTRSYTTFSDGGFQNQSEISDVADRMKAYAISIRVEAELDLNDPIVRSTVATFVSSADFL